MSAKKPFYLGAVGRAFQPLNIGRLMRGFIVNMALTGLLFVLATASDGLTEIILWCWAGLRWASLALLVATISGIAAERERRLSALPQGWRSFLITGEVQPSLREAAQQGRPPWAKTAMRGGSL